MTAIVAHLALHEKLWKRIFGETAWAVGLQAVRDKPDLLSALNGVDLTLPMTIGDWQFPPVTHQFTGRPSVELWVPHRWSRWPPWRSGDAAPVMPSMGGSTLRFIVVWHPPPLMVRMWWNVMVEWWLSDEMWLIALQKSMVKSMVVNSACRTRLEPQHGTQKCTVRTHFGRKSPALQRWKSADQFPVQLSADAEQVVNGASTGTWGWILQGRFQLLENQLIRSVRLAGSVRLVMVG